MSAVAPTNYIAIGPNCWGSGLSAGEALHKARQNMPRYNLREGALFCVYRVSPDSYVDEMGYIVSPHNEQPVFIKSVPVKEQ